MVNAINTAVSSGADGIAVSLIDLHAFNVPVENALKAGIPVVAYNADAPSNKRLSYIGQDLKLAGELMGKRIVEDVPSGEVVIFIATPGSANLQPRLEGAEKAIKDSGKPITLKTIATGSLPSGEKTAIEAYWTGHTEHEGDVRRRRRRAPKLAGVMQKLGLNAPRRQGRGLRPGRKNAETAPRRLPRIHDRPAALPAGVPADPAAVPMAGIRVAVGSGGSDTGLKFLEQRKRHPVRQLQEPLRGHLL
jgi:simple sugar transport system substrate-binding protein